MHKFVLHLTNCRRDPESLLKPQRNSSSLDSTDSCPKMKAELEKLKPAVNRHIFMIRHGHYNVDGETDEQRILSPLGKDFAFLSLPTPPLPTLPL